MSDDMNEKWLVDGTAKTFEEWLEANFDGLLLNPFRAATTATPEKKPQLWIDSPRKMEDAVGYLAGHYRCRRFTVEQRFDRDSIVIRFDWTTTVRLFSRDRWALTIGKANGLIEWLRDIHEALQTDPEIQAICAGQATRSGAE